jgi:UDP-glucose 4-epimerase
VADPQETRHQPVLVTGGSGYLGSLVVARLAAAGVPTLSVDVRAPRDDLPGVEHHTGDLRELDLATLLTEREVRAVVHLAAIVEPPKEMSEEELEDIEVGGTRRMVDACVAAGVDHLTVTSSGAAYGYSDRNDGRLLAEDTPTHGSPEFAYSRHKAEVEALLAQARRLHPQLAQLVLRPGTILGAGTDNQITALFTGRMVLTFWESAGPFTFIWDQDVADIVVAGVLRRRSGIYNLAGDGVMTMRDIARVEGVPVVSVPATAVRGALRLGHRLGVGRYGPEQVDFLLHRPVLDNTRLRRDFPGLPTKTTRETYEIFRGGRRG